MPITTGGCWCAITDFNHHRILQPILVMGVYGFYSTLKPKVEISVQPPWMLVAVALFTCHATFKLNEDVSVQSQTLISLPRKLTL